MPPAMILSFRKFGELIPIRRVPNCRFGKANWLCKCSCGNESIVSASLLTKGHTRSCGCKSSRNTIGSRMLTHGYTVGGKTRPEYYIWSNMVDRCSKPTAKAYKYYGARGIKVCERWIKFQNFIDDMGDKPSPRHSLDRRDSNGNYEPNNCRWATKLQQARNMSRNLKIPFRGRVVTLAEAAEMAGVDYKLLWIRVRKKGMEIEAAIKDVALWR